MARSDSVKLRGSKDPGGPAADDGPGALRREVGVINIGGAGWISLDGRRHDLGRLDSLYVGRGIETVVFGGDSWGEPCEPRTVFMDDGEAVFSPSWSMHSGVGTADYRFVWSMGGENLEFDDMDVLSLAELGPV